MDGVINVNKPLGITSHDVVYRLRRMLNIKKIGHTGTLDPDASGVLPMCIGKGTKLSDFICANDKQYLAELTLGAITDTQDKSGEVLERFEVNVAEEDIKKAVKNFVGEIKQIPPMYSAIKINGKKLYELARKGETIERPERTVTINSIEIKNIDMDLNTVTVLVDCSKGTYIRTLCEDIGRFLGCGGYMSSLMRTRSGRFSIEDSFTLEEIEEMIKEERYDFFIPAQDVMQEYEKIVLSERNAKKVRNGIKISVEGLEKDKVYRVFDEKDEFLVIAKQGEEHLEVLRTFYDGSQG